MAQIIFALDLQRTLRLELTREQKETDKGETGYREFKQ
jgi:hypothetical protein